MRDPCITVSHVAGMALVPRQDMRHIVVEPVERVIKGQRGVAAKAENVAHAMRLEETNHRLRACHHVLAMLGGGFIHDMSAPFWDCR